MMGDGILVAFEAENRDRWTSTTRPLGTNSVRKAFDNQYFSL